MTKFQIRDDGIFQLESVGNVQIVDLQHQQPFPGYHYYTMNVRAKITTPSVTCTVTYANAKIVKNGATLGSATMSRESAGSDWWKTSNIITLGGLQPGDIIEAVVESTWMCTEHGESTGPPVTLP